MVCSTVPLPESPFDLPPFRRFLAARVATTMAYLMVAVAVGWQVYDLTRRPLDLGLVGLAQFIPALLLVLVVGLVADRYPRQRIAALSQGTGLLICLALAVLSSLGLIRETLIFALVFAIGASRAFESPTMQALAPSLVPADLFPRAAAWYGSATQGAVILGPALGGLLYLAGPTTVYGVAAGLYALAAGLTAGLPKSKAAARTPAPVGLESLFAGIAFIRSRQVMLGAISLDMFAVLLGGATALLPVYARDILHTGSWGLGLLRSAPALGAVTMALYLARRPLKRGVGRTMLKAVAVFGLGTLVFALSPWFSLSLLALTVMGAADMISVVVRSSLVQLQTPDAMRGRVSAVNAMFIGTSNQLGEFESGLTAAWFGTVPAVVLGGLGTLAVVALWWRLFPRLRDADRLEAETDPGN